MKQEKASQLSFGDLQMQRRKVKSEFFNQINAVIDWDPLRALIEPAYAKGFSPTGRPCYDCMVLFRMELMRTWYGLSDGKICGTGQDARAAHHGGYRLQPVPNAGDYCVQLHQIRGKQGVREALANRIFHGFMPFKALL